MATNTITKLADAVQRMEGYYPGTRGFVNHNPGNIWDGIGGGKVRRIWPNIPTDDKGFLVFPSYEAGRAALERDLRLKVGRGMTLTELISMYAPPNENDTGRYIANVSQWTGFPVDVPLVSLGDGGPGLPPVVVASIAPGEAPATSAPSPEEFFRNLWAGDDSDTSTLLAAGAVLLAAAFLL